jgi:glycolate oxidase iron-sulfur subunit
MRLTFYHNQMLNTNQIIAEADRCVACGLCLPHCPTYHKTGSEADSPRGRIQLMSAVARDILPANARYQQHIDLCLSCRNCETACPNGVQYGALIDSARAQIAQSPNATKPSFLNTSLKHLACKPISMRLAGQSLFLAQKTGLLKLANLVPALQKPLSLLPDTSAPQKWQTLYKTELAKQGQKKQGDVNLFLGCISSVFDTETLRASIFVLNKLGFDVHIPSQQACCGGLARQQGDTTTANKLIAQNNAAFNKAYTTLTIASGCGAGLNDYADVKVMDISAFLAQANWADAELLPLAKDIILHDPCTLRNVQKSEKAVYALLQKIPQANVKPLSGNTQCCGGAGAYMLNQPDMAKQLLADKVKAVTKANASILATSNIGCALHIAAGLRAQKMAVEVLHPVSIIAKQMSFNGKLV